MRRILHVLVEGDSDEDFVDIVIKPCLIVKNKYDEVIPFKYANTRKDIVESYVSTVKAKGDDIICLTDLTHAPCVSGRIEQLINHEIGTFDAARIFVVMKEIEGWYLAGFDSSGCKRIHISYERRTDGIRKGSFNQLISKSKYRPRVACMYEMLKHFDLQLASERNKSFYRIFDRFLK